MKTILKIFSKIFTINKDLDSIPSNEENFFDYSAAKKIKILRAAGKDAQKDQQKLLKRYEARFGRSI